MDANLFYEVYFNRELRTKEEVYSFISEMVCQDEDSQKDEIIKQLIEREQVGSTLIADHVMLPHIESDQVKKSRILFIRLVKPIALWDPQTKDIQLLIVLLLKKNEVDQIKKKISLFSKTLADEDYLNRLLEITDKKVFEKEMIKI
ncbi:MAG: PTS sugar transporter subunit IIA [Carnobacterium sp.]|uniref:PTS sugar transporter subunit IIA n=1 Tax=Carnobacterium sp. TaxID=48221 RepID=UPI003315D3B5